MRSRSTCRQPAYRLILCGISMYVYHLGGDLNVRSSCGIGSRLWACLMCMGLFTCVYGFPLAHAQEPNTIQELSLDIDAPSDSSTTAASSDGLPSLDPEKSADAPSLAVMLVQVDKSQRLSEPPLGYHDLLKKGRAAYNDGDYDAARSLFVEAIQVAPWMAEPYKNLARTLFYLSQFLASSVYYHYYTTSSYGLVLETNDRDAIIHEESMAQSRITHAESMDLPVVKHHRDTLEKALQNEGSGKSAEQARTAYLGLIRAGYAAPDLLTIQNKLSNTLAAAIATELAAPIGRPTRPLTLSDIDRIQTWLHDLKALARAEHQIKWAERRQSALNVIHAATIGNAQAALDHLEEAQTRNPDLPQLVWYGVQAYLLLGRPKDAAALARSKKANKSRELQRINKDWETVLGSSLRGA